MRPAPWSKLLTTIPLVFVLMSRSSDRTEKPLLNVEDMAPVYNLADFPHQPSASLDSQELPVILATGWGYDETTPQDPTTFNWGSFPLIKKGSSVTFNAPFPPHEVLITPFTVDLATGDVDESKLSAPITCQLAEDPQCTFTQVDDRTIQFTLPEQLFENPAVNAFSIYATWITSEGESAMSWAARIAQD